MASYAGDKYNIGIVNINLRTYYVEGSKTLAFEVCEQLGWNAPDHVIVPTGSGAIVARVTSGIEPIFATSYQRNVKKNEKLKK